MSYDILAFWFGISFLTLLYNTNSSSDRYITCDFDLENIQEILPYLPEKCKQIYNAGHLAQPEEAAVVAYDSYQREAKQFGDFYKKLDEYERGNEENDNLVVYPFDAKLRNTIYAKANWIDCITSANEIDQQYINCIMGKRVDMIKLVPAKS